MIRLNLRTLSRFALVKITPQVQSAIDEAGFSDGLCCVYVPHTTAGVTVNESWDPSVAHDIQWAMDNIVPPDSDPGYQHSEGNSQAHVASAITGSSVTVIVEGGRLMLGRWQGIFFCEYDGPRNREVWVKLIGAEGGS